VSIAGTINLTFAYTMTPRPVRLRGVTGLRTTEARRKQGMTTDEWNDYFKSWRQKMSQAWVNHDQEEQDWLRLEMQMTLEATESPFKSFLDGTEGQHTGSDDTKPQEGLEK